MWVFVLIGILHGLAKVKDGSCPVIHLENGNWLNLLQRKDLYLSMLCSLITLENQNETFLLHWFCICLYLSIWNKSWVNCIFWLYFANSYHKTLLRIGIIFSCIRAVSLANHYTDTTLVPWCQTGVMMPDWCHDATLVPWCYTGGMMQHWYHYTTLVSWYHTGTMMPHWYHDATLVPWYHTGTMMPHWYHDATLVPQYQPAVLQCSIYNHCVTIKYDKYQLKPRSTS